MKRFINKISAQAYAPALFLLFATSMISCQESWQERAMRETREMSIRQCPHYLTEGLIVDSLKYDPTTNARHTYYTFVDSLIDTTLITTDNMLAAHDALVDEVRNDMGLRTLKKHDASFHYLYRLQSNGHILFVDSVTADEYKRAE